MRNRLIVLMIGFLPLLSIAAEGGPPFKGQPGRQLAFLLVLLVILAAFSIGFTAILSLFALFRPETVRNGSDFLRRHPFRCLLQGILIVVLTLGIVALAGHLPEPVSGLLAILLILVLAGLTVIGWAMIAQEIGDRFLSSVQSRLAGSVVMAVIVGSLLVALLPLLPVAGQLLQLVLWLMGMGAALSYAGRRRSRPPLEAEQA